MLRAIIESVTMAAVRFCTVFLPCSVSFFAGMPGGVAIGLLAYKTAVIAGLVGGLVPRISTPVSCPSIPALESSICEQFFRGFCFRWILMAWIGVWECFIS